MGLEVRELRSRQKKRVSAHCAETEQKSIILCKYCNNFDGVLFAKSNEGNAYIGAYGADYSVFKTVSGCFVYFAAKTIKRKNNIKIICLYHYLKIYLHII